MNLPKKVKKKNTKNASWEYKQKGAVWVFFNPHALRRKCTQVYF